jgi:Ca2+-binding EF-hand superfamily protein
VSVSRGGLAAGAVAAGKGLSGMKPHLALLIAWTLAAAPAHGARAAAPGGRPARMFLSPSGEPFRPAPGAPNPFDAWFDQADANHDGAIDRAEFRADGGRFFKRLDTNGDGVIDGFELAAYEANVVPEMEAEMEGRVGLSEPADGGDRNDHGPREKGGERGRPKGMERLIDEPEPVSGADFALDGRITFAEWMRAADQRFDTLDANKDGRLTKQELKTRLESQAKSAR